ncbi:MAG: hypothetical protein U5J99_10205 [Parvularculaceae bacterium]|nr:hypothetical protein [Parvularculaceae bacterium]
MAMRKVSDKNGISVWIGKLADNNDDFNDAYSLALTPDQRLRSVTANAVAMLRLKGIDVDARRLDRVGQIVRGKKGKISGHRRDGG